MSCKRHHELSPIGTASEIDGTGKDSGSKVRGFRNFEPGTSDRTNLACLARRALRSVAHGKRPVSARGGRADEKTDPFSILQVIEGLASIAEQIIVGRYGFASRGGRIDFND